MFTQLFAQVYGVSLPQFAEAGAALEARKNVLGEVMERELVAGRKLLVDDRVGAFDMLTWRLLDTEIVPAFGGHLGLSVFGGVDEVGDASRRAELLAGVGGEEGWAWFFHNIRDHDFREGDDHSAVRNTSGAQSLDVPDCAPLVFRTQLKEANEEAGTAEVIVRFSAEEPERLPADATLRYIEAQERALGTLGIPVLAHLDDCVAFAPEGMMDVCIDKAKEMHNMMFHEDGVDAETIKKKYVQGKGGAGWDKSSALVENTQNGMEGG